MEGRGKERGMKRCYLYQKENESTYYPAKQCQKEWKSKLLTMIIG